MDKRILNEIAKRWSKGILLANDITDQETMDMLSEAEQDYLLEATTKIANKITNSPNALSLNELIKEYYDFD